MSIIAGIYSRQGRPIPESTCEELYEAISRNKDDQRIVYRESAAYLVKVDIGAYGEPAFRIDPQSGSVAMMAGDAVLRSGPTAHSRSAELEYLQQQLDEGDTRRLDLVTGVFALAHYDARQSRLVLATDKIGLHPFYCWVGEDYVVFATALRILEAVTLVPKRMDVVGVTELTIYPQYPGNDRTSYADIKRQRGGTAITIERGAIRKDLYYDWRTALRGQPIGEEDGLVRTHDAFMAGIERRLRGDRVVPACLSGGLDSRCVVAGLRSLDVDVYTFCYYAVPDSQERVFAAEFARVAGTHHTEIQSPVWEGGHTFERQIAAAWSSRLQKDGIWPSRPWLLWTGDGGSVGLGHVFVEPEQLSHLRNGDGERALIALRSNHLTPNILKPKWAEEVREAILADFREQMDWIGSDPARAFYLYLMLNEQRDDFREHFENLDLHRIEFQAPFYDPDFITSVMALPVDLCTQHKFYHKWLRTLPHAAAVPWSTYPGHEPCPLAHSSELASQWGNRFALERHRVLKKQLVRSGLRALARGRFPHSFLRRGRVVASTFLHWAGLRDCATALGSVDTYHRYWQVCEHRVAPLQADTSSMLAGPDPQPARSVLR